MARVHGYFGPRTRARRELAIFLVAFFVGLVVMPLLIWFVGSLVLGPYENGGAIALLSDFMGGLLQGSPAFWAVALGPYAGVLFVRLACALIRRCSPAADET